MACNICGQAFNNRFQLGPHKRQCNAAQKRRRARVQGCSSTESENEANVITTPVQVVRQTQEQVCLRACANRERDWPASTRALFATRPHATPNNMARDYRPVSYAPLVNDVCALHLLRTHFLLAWSFIVCMIGFSFRTCGSMFSE